MTFPLRSTTAWERGETAVFQHSWCGALVVVDANNADPRKKARGLLARCPWTGCQRPFDEWWEQSLPVGPFDKGGG